jgi:signal transduction histidine kinase
VNRNLITRMATASFVVAALVAAVFAVLITAVHAQRSATDRARRSDQVGAAAADLRRAVTAVDLGRRGRLGDAPDVALAQRALPGMLARLRRLGADGDAGERARIAGLAGAAERYLAAPSTTRAAGVERRAGQLAADEQATADDRRHEADRRARQAIALGIGGLVGSALLIALLTTYLTRYIVVPLRRTVRAARRLTLGDLSARVVEEGDDEPVELARAFNQMAVSLEESERLKDEFFALVSHELRTPLTSIIGYLELVLDDAEQLSEDQRRFLEVVDRNAKRLLRLVGDMLFVAQVEAGRLSLERQEVDLRTVATEAVEAARPAAQRGCVALELDATGVRLVPGDRDRFGQMLDNLISNALKFTPENGAVVVRLRDAGSHVVIEVIDDGIGIPDADRRRLFERFFRASSATGRSVPGAGLGLTIVKTIVEAHGGSIVVDSAEGEGTTVRVELPYERVEAAA